MTFPSQPYKGTRDFYPEDMARRNYIFQTWRNTLIQSGFVEYDASILENADIYVAKSGEELGSKQLYHFYDKGERHVALRPEMTPTLARIVAERFGQLRFPLRWFSIPNCFRYERPQKGRLREFWQLNVDIIGAEAGGADLEMLYTTVALFKAFGAKQHQYKILFNHRKVLDLWLEKYDLMAKKELIYAVLDDWFKVSIEENTEKLISQEQTNPLTHNEVENVIALVGKSGQQWQDYMDIAQTFDELKLILEVIPSFTDVTVEFSPTIIRGIAYYTGLVIEGFDNNPANPRAMFGGGRYDNLLELFGQEAKAIGIGIGDVTWAEFLDNWDLWPDFNTGVKKIGILPLSESSLSEIYTTIIPKLQQAGTLYDIDYSFNRSENKRYETLKKRGCDKIVRI